jgi:hypothetical protein
MKVEVIIPDSLSELTLGQYQKYLKIQENNTDDMFLASKMLEIFCGIKMTDTLKMKFADVDSICSIIVDLLEQKPNLVRKFRLNGKQYGFIPKLDDISLGEYVDLDAFLGDWENMHRAMAVLYRPIEAEYGDKYSIVDYTPDDAEIMREMPLDAVISSIIFFYHLGIDLSQAMMNYLKEEQESNLVQYLSSEQNGVGINQFTHSLKGILDDLKISLN